MNTTITTLVATICGSLDHPLATLLSNWCAASRRFSAFAQTYATKLRKKVRLANDADALQSVTAELAVAELLLRDRRCAVAYEQFASTGQRSTDFSVMFKDHIQFNVEVTRLRSLGLPAEADSDPAVKVARVICDKLGQFPPGVMNVLVIVVDAVDSTVVAAAIRLLDGYAQRRDESFVRATRLKELAAYHRQQPRLSAVVLRSFHEDWSVGEAAIWNNQQAKHQLPPEIFRVLIATTAAS